MQSPPTESVSGMEFESSQAVTDSMCTSSILRIIFQHCPNTELIQISLVSKQWNNEARSVLRNRGNLYAKIGSNHPCQHLKVFASYLRGMNIVPFSGIRIDLMSLCDVVQGCLASHATELDPSYDVILDQLQWKYLSVEFHWAYEEAKGCPAFLLVKRILKDYGGGLGYLSLNIEFGRASFIEQVLRACRFSQLRTLRLYHRRKTTSADNTNLIKALVSRAPILRTISIFHPVDLTENLMEGSPARLFAYFDVCPTVYKTSEGLIHAIRMTRVKLLRVRYDLSPGRSFITPTLLQLSHLTLKAVDIDAALLVLFMCYRIPFDNVTEFQIQFNCLQPFQPRILRLIEAFDFTQIFPRLTQVQSIGDHPSDSVLQDEMIEMIELWNPAFSKYKRDRAVNIKELVLNFSRAFEDECSVGFFPAMLPHVEKLSLSAYRGKLMTSALWELNWKDLKELKVLSVASSLPGNANLDSLFCGIFPEEVAELRGKDDEYLKAVNVVPVQPSIGCLKGLRTFTFTGGRSLVHNDAFEDNVLDPAYILSRVTGLLCFKRCSNLSVTLETDHHEVFKALDHLKPYARVVRRSPIISFRQSLNLPSSL